MAVRVRPAHEAELRAITGATRLDDFADDFPQPGDTLIAGHYVADPPTSHAEPWGVWLIESSGLVVGSVCLKHPPDADGAVEIGYGVCPSHRGRGIAQVAVHLVAELARRAGARCLVADTEHLNAASRGVLAATGFAVERTEPTALWWRLQL